MVMVTRFEAEHVEMIEELLEEYGMTIREVCTATFTCTATLHRSLRRYGVQVRRQGEKVQSRKALDPRAWNMIFTLRETQSPGMRRIGEATRRDWEAS